MLLSRLKNWLAGFFYFNKQERNGLFVLCVLLFLLIAVRISLPLLFDGNAVVELITLKDVSVAPLQEASPEPFKSSKKEIPPALHTEKFIFNPNEISLEEAKLLGFPEKLAKTLLKFRDKGGKFFKPADLQKLYGMSPRLYDELEPYILIPDKRLAFKRDTIYPKREHYKKELIGKPLELNSADSLAIVYLKGVGPGFTKRIIRYRTLLGGFYTMEQLKEVYGMTDSLYNILNSQIVVDKSLITRIPVNAADLNTLRKHPYLSFQAAQAIINYRNKHGKLTEADMVGLGVIPEEKLKRVLPYLQY